MDKINIRRILLLIALFLCIIKYFNANAIGQVIDVETTEIIHIVCPDENYDEQRLAVINEVHKEHGIKH